MNIIPALIRKVVSPIKLYKRPPTVNPIMLARLEKLLATPCTTPWLIVPARFESIDITDGYIRPLPNANNTAAP